MDMELGKDEIEEFRRKGLLFRENCISEQIVVEVRREIARVQAIEHPAKVYEDDQKTVRALHGCHLESGYFREFVRRPDFLYPVNQILKSEVYLYQFKINLKSAFNGDVWPWHQDFIFWKNEDGMEKSDVVSVVLFVDDVSEFNAPLFFIPETHKDGTIACVMDQHSDTKWQDNVGAQLNYTLDNLTVEKLANEKGMVAPKGKAGSVLFFDSNVVHGSTSNISPYQRRLLLLTYNSTANIPHCGGNQRPEFLVARDHTPLKLNSTL